MRTGAENVALAIGLLVTCAIALLLPRSIEQFSVAYASFGLNLPVLTKIFLHHGYLLWLLPALVLAVWLFWPAHRRRILATYLVAIGGSLLVYAVAIVAMQLPAHQLSI